MNTVRLKTWGRLFGAMILIALIASACGSGYHTIGAGPEGIQLPTKSSGAKGAPTKASGAKTLPTATKPKSGAAAPQAQAAKPILCRLSDLTPSATWSAAGDSLVGTLELTNYWDVGCTLRGHPIIGLTDDTGTDFILQRTVPTASVTMPTWAIGPNTTIEIRFTWLNWCDPLPKGGIRVTVADAGSPEPVLYVPVQDGNGNLLGDSPPCKAKGQPSTLKEETLKLINR